MTNQQRVLVVAVLVVAVVGGGWLAISVLGGGGSSDAAASPSAAAVVSPDPGSPSAEPSESAPPTESPPSETPTGPPATASAEPTATPEPPNPPGPPATIVLTQLKLDAKDDPDGKNRRIEFESQGSGDITVDLAVLSPQGNATMCLRADDKQLGCKTTAAGRLTANTTTKHADFVLTLRGEGIQTPIVDVTVTFPATTPTVTIANARFDGMDYPETNGIQAMVTPRADGDVTLDADWGGHPFIYEIDLLEQGGPGTHVLADQGPATRVSESLPVTAPNPWKLVLQNIQGGFGVTELDAIIAWP